MPHSGLVSADMFGMALRAYIRKVRRLTESATETDQTLWQAVLSFIKKEHLVSRQRILERFARDGEIEVSSILRDLSESGLVFSSGNGPSSAYRVASEEELGQLSAIAQGEGSDELAWVFIFRSGPLSVAQLSELLSQSETETQQVVSRLVGDGRVQRHEDRLSASEFVIPLDGTIGWEASVFDHFHAVVQTICQRLQEATQATEASGRVGGSTFTFDVWPGHPHYEEVQGLLAEHRERLMKLRKRRPELLIRGVLDGLCIG